MTANLEGDAQPSAIHGGPSHHGRKKTKRKLPNGHLRARLATADRGRYGGWREGGEGRKDDDERKSRPAGLESKIALILARTSFQ